MVLGVRDTRRALAWGSGRGRHRRGRSSFGGGRLILEIALVLIEISLAPHHSAEESIAAGTPLYCRATGEHPFLARSNLDPAHLRTGGWKWPRPKTAYRKPGALRSCGGSPPRSPSPLASMVPCRPGEPFARPGTGRAPCFSPGVPSWSPLSSS